MAAGEGGGAGSLATNSSIHAPFQPLMAERPRQSLCFGWKPERSALGRAMRPGRGFPQRARSRRSRRPCLRHRLSRGCRHRPCASVFLLFSPSWRVRADALQNCSLALPMDGLSVWLLGYPRRMERSIQFFRCGYMIVARSPRHVTAGDAKNCICALRPSPPAPVAPASAIAIRPGPGRAAAAIGRSGCDGGFRHDCPQRRACV